MTTTTARSGYSLAYPFKGIGGGKGQDAGQRAPGAYYTDPVRQGEPAGRWAGRGAAVLGFAPGQEIDRKLFEQVYSQVDPRTGEQLGRKPGGYAQFRGNYERLLAAEPYATAERQLQLERQAAQETRRSPAYTDMTNSYVKSISVLGASIRENARMARESGDLAGAQYWDAAMVRLQEIEQAANRAGLDHLQDWAATRTGYHGKRVGDHEPGRYEPVSLVVSSFLQHTSRDGDPQDHIHNLIMRMGYTDSDGKWRAVDTMAIRKQLGAVNAIVTAHVEAALSREFGVQWVPRVLPSGEIVREIRGITAEQRDAYSSRTQAINDAAPEAIADWVAKHGRTPNRSELKHIMQRVTLETRKGKEPTQIDWDKEAAAWNAKLGGDLAPIARKVTTLGAGNATQPESREPSQVAQRACIRTALSSTQARHATWTRADLMREIASALPDDARTLAPADAVALVQRLTDEALSGAVEQVTAREYPEPPPGLIRDLDGRSVYSRPGSIRYSTHVQLSKEEQLVRQAAAPALAMTAEQSACLLGAEPQALAEAGHDRAQDQGERLSCGLRMDQAAALHHALTEPRRVSVIVGPAGSGKTRVLAEAARVWQEAGLGEVVGVAPSQAARNVLVSAAHVEGFNTAQFLGHTISARGALGAMALKPGTLVLIDEGSMVSSADLSDLIDHAEQCGAKVLLAGDHGQLTAVEGGGGMALLARQGGWLQLATPVRFSADWEREASLRLRTGDKAVLALYDSQGRLRGGPADQIMDEARRTYVAGVLGGRDLLMMAASHDTCRELSQRIRDDLQHLGLVGQGTEATLREGAACSVGDLIITRTNDHDLGVANGHTWRVEGIEGEALTLRRLIDCGADGTRKYSDDTITYTDAANSADLAYVSTAHSAQGRTVYQALALFTGNETREWGYVALTRATDGNFAYVVTDNMREAEPEAGTRAAPEVERHERIMRERAGLPEPPQEPQPQEAERPYLGVLSDVLDREGAELSAMETRDTELANADHLGILHTIYQDQTRDAVQARYETLLRERLPAEYQGESLSYCAAWLWRSLRGAEAAGLDAGDVLDRALAQGSLHGAHDVAAVVDARVRQETAGMVPVPARPWAEQCPAEAGEYAGRVAAAMDARKQRLGPFIAETAPAYALRALGPVPEDEDGRKGWERRASSIEAYRSLFGFEDALEAIGPEPDGDSPEKRQAWHEAFAAMGPVDGIDLRKEHDGRLLLMRATYASETEWAPRHVGAELREARLRAQDAQTRAALSEAELTAARERGDQSAVARHEANAATARADEQTYSEHVGIFSGIMRSREDWERVTEGSRRLAVAADTELRRRGAEVETLTSAEPDRPSEAQRAQLEASPGYQAPEFLSQWAAEARAAADQAAERRTQRVPDEQDDEAEGQTAWDDVVRLDRDAIIQGPKPEIRPAPEVEAQRDREAGG